LGFVGAQRGGAARPLLLGTYRPADLTQDGHPLRAITQELHAHGHCREVSGGLLTEAEVTRYLELRFPKHRFPPELGPAVHRRTEGNALFVVNLVDYWVGHRVLVDGEGYWPLAAPLEDIAVGVPDGLRQMIQKQLERLTVEQRRGMEAAAVAGADFSAAAVAAGLGESEDRVEEWCEELAGRRFL